MSDRNRIVAWASWLPDRPELRPNELGGKATGLMALDLDWTPPFVVLGAPFRAAWERDGRSAAMAFERAAAEDARLLRRLVDMAGELERVDGLIVRSNAPSEAHTDRRGRFTSIDTAPGDLMAAIDEVMTQEVEGEAPFAVLQLRMRRVAAGHLSNERRVAERPSQWVVEDESRESDLATPLRRRFTLRDSEPLALEVGDRGSLDVALRQVAYQMRGQRGERTHCEWVWDGRRLWLVQRDIIVDRRGDVAGAYLGSENSLARPRAGTLRRVVELTADEAESWSKLRRRSVMEQLGMPVAPVLFLSGTTFAEEVANGCAELRLDLADLTAGGVPLVLRSDLSRAYEAASLSLPTSAPLTSVDALLDAMAETADELARRGVPTSAWGFLPASLVQARASVMVQARPKTQRTRLDALWGFPDGVGCLPHDSYYHHVESNRVERRKSYKGTCLLWSAERGWIFEPVPAPYDWDAVLDDDEVRLASGWAQRLADHLSSEVQLMVLTRIDGHTGPSALLPWHYTDHEAPRGRAVEFAPIAGVATVRGPSDLESEAIGDARGIVFRPTAAERRNNDFIQRVGRLAAESRRPVYFEGSTLGHAFYVLASTGAEVIAIGPEAPGARPDEYNKLVRDRIPDIIAAGGGQARVRRANRSQASWLLKQKLVEEALEIWAGSDSELLSELADIVEVVTALRDQAGLSAEEVEAARTRKRARAGGFDELVYLETTLPDAGVDETGEPGARSLFEDVRAPDEVVSAAPVAAKGPVEILEDRDVRVTFRVPLAPPLRQGVPLRIHEIEVGGARLRFKYEGAFLEISVTEHESIEGTPQLSLPVDPP